MVFNRDFHRTLSIVLLAAIYAPLSQLVLSPVYGSLPASAYHKWGVFISCMLAYAIRGYVPVVVERSLAAFVWWIPTIQFLLLQLSSMFGTPWGAVITECLTTFPAITLSLYTASKNLEKVELGLSESLAESAPPMINYFIFTISTRTMKNTLPRLMGINKFCTRVSFQFMTAAVYSLLLPRNFFWPAWPSLLFTPLGNIHTPLDYPTEILQNTLGLYNYTLIDRHESLTGYLSVLEDHNKGFRVMRADHSLLGGIWTNPPNQAERVVDEPVYAVFTMLESVRLVQREKTDPNEPDTAFVVGVGVGTAPSALIAHGIDTTVVELDPVVHQWAQKYFDMPVRHTAYIGDARAVVEAQRRNAPAQYDYIIHDVFTGGAEPLELFTLDFLTGLRQMLKPNGAIAINYAGNLALPSTSMIYRTIREIFPSCRVFREDEQVAVEDTYTAMPEQPDLTNIVFICTRASTPVTFRTAVEADYLGSPSRRSYLIPKHEVAPSHFEPRGELLTSRNIKTLQAQQLQSAIGHWKLMRTVLPDGVWNAW